MILAATAGGVTPLLASAGKDAIDPAAFAAFFAKRQTVRKYKSDPVPEEHIKQILDAARRAPCCMNQQAWKFLVVRDPAKIAAMKKATLDLIGKRYEEYIAKQPAEKAAELALQKARSVTFASNYFTAPCYVAVLVDRQAPCSGYALGHDGPIAAGYLMLAARAFGYGTAYLTDGIPEEVARKVLAIPDRYHRVCVTPIGIPDGWPKAAYKRKLEENVVWEDFSNDKPLEKIPYNP